MRIAWPILTWLLAVVALGQELPGDRVFVTPDPTPRTAEREVIERLGERLGQLAIVPLTVGTLDELRQIDPATISGEPKLVRVSGYWSPTGPGGGIYMATNTVLGTNARGGRIAAAGGAWSWENINRTPAAEEFGAMGDGLTDDTDSINAGLEWTCANLLPLVCSRLYRLEGQVRCLDNTLIEFGGTGIFRRHGTHVALRNHPYSYPGDTPQAPDVVVAVTNITLRNGTIDNDDQATSSPFPLVQMYGVDGVRWEGMRLGGPTNGLKDNWLCSFWANNVRLSDCHLEAIPGIFNDAFHALGGRVYTLVNSTFIGGDDALAFLHIWDLGLSDVTVANCHLVSYSAHCIRIGRWNAVTPASQTNRIERLLFRNITGEFGHRNGGIYLQDWAVSGTNYTRLVDNVLLSGIYLKCNDTFPTFGTTNSYGFNVTGCSNVVFVDVCVEGAINKAQVNWNSHFRAERLKLRNSSGQVLSFNGTGRVELDDPDLSSDRATQNVYFLDTWSVAIRGGEISNTASTYNVETGANVNDLSIIGTKLHSGNKGVRLFVSPAEFTAEANLFLANAGIQFSTGGAPAYTKVTGNVNQTDYVTGIVDHHTPNFVPLQKYYRDDFSSSLTLMEFNLSGNLPTWYTTNANWFRYQAGRGQYGWKDSTDNADKEWSFGVGNYDSDRNAVVLLRGISTSLKNGAYIGSGFDGDQPTEFGVYLATGLQQNSGILTMLATTNGIRVQPGGVAAPPTHPLELLSTTAGMVPPAMTGTQGNTLLAGSPTAGEQWFDTSAKKPRLFNGTGGYYLLPGLSGSRTFDLPSIASLGTSDFTVTVTGAVGGDTVLVQDPGFTSGLLFKGWVSAADTVTVRVVNGGAASYDHGSATYRVWVIPQ